jgi:hypothetical protein
MRACGSPTGTRAGRWLPRSGCLPASGCPVPPAGPWTEKRSRPASYASASCGSCGRDQALFLEIERTLRARGCSSIQLAPSDRAFSHPVDPLRVNLAFPSVPFASGLAVTSTPTTIVTDRDWKVSWSRIGTLRRSDVDAAVRAASRLP